MKSIRPKGAEILILTMGSMGETASIAIDELREEGIAAGLIKLRLWRPFPFEELKGAVKGAKRLIVTDRAISFGGPGGPVASEIRSAFYNEKDRPIISSFIIGMGGRDMTVEDFKDIILKSMKMKKQDPDNIVFYGVRE